MTHSSVANLNKTANSANTDRMETINVKYLQDLATECVNDIVRIVATQMDAKHRTASGRTIRETTTEVIAEGDTVSAKVLVPKWFPYIEKGSAPALRGTWFFKKIHQWAKDKHIISDDSTKSKRISGGIAYTIIHEGTKAHQIGGEDVFSTAVDERIEQFKREATLAVQTQINNLIHL